MGVSLTCSSKSQKNVARAEWMRGAGTDGDGWNMVEEITGDGADHGGIGGLWILLRVKERHELMRMLELIRLKSNGSSFSKGLCI